MPNSGFSLSADAGVNVLELVLPQQLDASEFDRLNEDLAAAVKGKAADAWVLDLAAVEYSGSAILGLMVNFRQQIKQGGGRLALASMSPRLMEVFRTCSLDRLFRTAPTRASAIKALS